MIAGAGRSGSTLLERILAASIPRATTVGELTEIWRRGLIEDDLCGCGEPFSACPHWTGVGERAFGGWGRVDPEEMIAAERLLRAGPLPLASLARVAPARRRALERYGGALTRIYGAVAEGAGAGTVIDASKWPRHLFVLRSLGLPLRVVHLVRDPRAVAHSWSRAIARPQGGGGAAMRTYRPAGSALRWLLFNLLAEAALASGTRGRRIAYARLVSDPAAAVAELLAGLGVEAAPPPSLARGEILLEPTHGIAGNPVRYRHGHLQVRADRRWREEMAHRDRLAVSAICAPLRPRYGDAWEG